MWLHARQFFTPPGKQVVFSLMEVFENRDFLLFVLRWPTNFPENFWKEKKTQTFNFLDVHAEILGFGA